MTQWLIKRWIEHSEDTENQRVRMAYGTLGSLTGIVVNLLLSGGKFAVGAMSGSLAIMADAANNLSDAGGSIMSLLTVRLAQKPVDSEHPFGHGRMEYIGALAVGVLIVLMGFQLLKDGISAILSPAALAVSAFTIAMPAISIGAKMWLYFFYQKLGKSINSATLMAAAKDSLSDVAATSGVLLSVVLELLFGWRIDGYMGVLVALFVLKTGVDVCRDTVDRLLGEKPDPEKSKQIRDGLLTYNGILGVHDLVMHDYGPGRCIASVHAEVSADANIVAVHELIDEAERELSHKFGLTLCIHTDPIVTDDESINDVHHKMEAYLSSLDSRMTMHDFRMVPGENKINLIFDCVLPVGYKGREQLLQKLTAYAQTMDPRYALVVQFDTDFC